MNNGREDEVRRQKVHLSLWPCEGGQDGSGCGNVGNGGVGGVKRLLQWKGRNRNCLCLLLEMMDTYCCCWRTQKGCCKCRRAVVGACWMKLLKLLREMGSLVTGFEKLWLLDGG